MSITERTQMSDLRVVYGLLATSALKELQRPANDASEVYLINLVRLLDMYRHGKLSGRRPHGVLESKPLRQHALIQRDRGERDVQEALDAAREFACPGAGVDTFVARTRETLLSLTQTKPTNAESIDLLKRFVAKLAEKLRSSQDS